MRGLRAAYGPRELTETSASALSFTRPHIMSVALSKPAREPNRSRARQLDGFSVARARDASACTFSSESRDGLFTRFSETIGFRYTRLGARLIFGRRFDQARARVDFLPLHVDP